MTCRICAGQTVEAFAAREMLLGLREEHRYLECVLCGCLQVAVIPCALSRYYSDRFYYSQQVNSGLETRGRLRATIGNWLDEAQIFSRRGVAGAIARRRKSLVAERLKSFVGDSPVRSRRARILDVGCGSGGLVHELALHGFWHAEGIDPYMPDHAVRADGVPRLRRLTISELTNQQYDVVLLTHVLEHLEDPVEAVRAVSRLLAPGGVCRIEVPVADSAARYKYAAEWVELDAPRHLHVPTRKTVAIAARMAGLEVYRSEPAGSAFEFWGSELYRRGISLFDEVLGRYREPADAFTREELEQFDRDASEAAVRGVSGRERFFLRRVSPKPRTKADPPYMS